MIRLIDPTNRLRILLAVILAFMIPIMGQIMDVLVEPILLSVAAPVEVSAIPTGNTNLCVGDFLRYDLSVTSRVTDDVWVTRMFQRKTETGFAPARVVNSTIIPLEEGSYGIDSVSIEIPADFKSGEYRLLVSYTRITVNGSPSRYYIPIYVKPESECNNEQPTSTRSARASSLYGRVRNSNLRRGKDDFNQVYCSVF